MSLFRSFVTISSITAVSRVLGFVRDVLTAGVLGAGPVTDAFFVAFKLPNFMRRLFAEGAFSQAFVPLFAGMVAAEGKDRAKQFGQEAFSFLFWVLTALTIVIVAAMPYVMLVLAPGFRADPEKFNLAVDLTRITFPYLIFVSVTSLLMGVLNSLDKFAAPAAASCILNLCFIVAMLFFADSLETPAHALAWAVFAAGVLQWMWMGWFAHKQGMLLMPRRPRMTPYVKKLIGLMAPAFLGAGVVQVNLVVDMILASTIPNAVSYLYYGDRLNELPLGMIGIAIGTALLPILSRQFRTGEKAAANHTQNRALELAMLFALPAAVALVIMGRPIVTVLFEHGEFDAHDAAMTAGALMAFAVGLPAFVGVKIFQPGFFANQDMVTPVKIAMVCLVVNLVLNLILMQFWEHVGMALATSTAGWVNMIVCMVILRRRGIFTFDARMKKNGLRMVLASLAMGAALGGMVYETYALFVEPNTTTIRAVIMFGMIGVGLAVYFGLVTAMGVLRISEVKHYLKRGKA